MLNWLIGDVHMHNRVYIIDMHIIEYIQSNTGISRVRVHSPYGCFDSSRLISINFHPIPEVRKGSEISSGAADRVTSENKHGFLLRDEMDVCTIV